VSQETDLTRVKVTGAVNYPHLFKPKAFGSGAPKYSLTVSFAKNETEIYNSVRMAMSAAVQEGIDRGLFKAGEENSENFQSPLYDGDAAKSGSDRYPGQWYMRARNTYPPSAIVGPDRQPLTDEKSINRGDVCNVVVILYPYNYEGKCGVGCRLIGVQKTEDPEAYADSHQVQYTAEELFEVLV